MLIDELKSRVHFVNTATVDDFVKIKKGYHIYFETSFEVIMLRWPRAECTFALIVTRKQVRHGRAWRWCPLSRTKDYQSLRDTFPSLKSYDYGRSVRFSTHDDAMIRMLFTD